MFSYAIVCLRAYGLCNTLRLCVLIQLRLQASSAYGIQQKHEALRSQAKARFDSSFKINRLEQRSCSVIWDGALLF